MKWTAFIALIVVWFAGSASHVNTHSVNKISACSVEWTVHAAYQSTSVPQDTSDTLVSLPDAATVRYIVSPQKKIGEFHTLCLADSSHHRCTASHVRQIFLQTNSLRPSHGGIPSQPRAPPRFS